MKLLWVVVVLVILLLGGLTGYAYFGDMQADPRETRLPVELDLGPATASTPIVGTVSEAPAAEQPAPEAQETGAATTEQNDLD
ncbi:hypothetical protein RM190_05510 [Paracoccus sp. CPCC 101403]|uniref:Uncharacterized protein n=2 Tax=Paracoccus broussonetiae TaxID=3075834 RepID=A0ABU3EAQ9_9RHOB|nr:hypothetical protein [Paracoccus sp. CPCC 101403]MDT1061309.1 hypothetical protein [Paracoccus sp. CPCC 101403]